MNEDTASGRLTQVKGQVKQSVGEAVGNESLANSGAIDQVKGSAQEVWGHVKDVFHDKTATARAEAQTGEARASSEATNTAHDLRDKITADTLHAKDVITEKLSEMRKR